MQQKFTTLLLDLDGLLIDSEKVYHEVGYKMTEELGKELSKDIIAKQMGRSPYESLDIYRRELGITDFTTQELVDWRDAEMRKAYSENIDLMPGSMDLMKKAMGKYRMAIATGSTRNLVDIVIEKLKLDIFMEHVQPSDEIERGKPNPDIFLECARQMGVEPSECIVLEDSSNGCIAGKRAGCYVIAVPTEYTYHQDFTSADVVVNDLFEAWDKIQKLGC